MKKLYLILLLFPLLVFGAEPTNYYNAAVGYTEAALRTALNSIIKDPSVTSYNGLWTAYGTTDINPANGKIWDMYSNCSFTLSVDQNRGTTGPECTNYNREHSIPQSWFNEASPMVSDAFHVYPTDSKVNGIRSNYPFGEVGSASTTTGNGSKLGSSNFPSFSGTVFEPINEYKGDFARTYFYMATCYAGKCESWSGGVFGNQNLGLTAYGKDIFLKWHRQDPVSTKETNRNNAVYGIQKNRNPFIDHPELAEYIWGNKKGTPWSLTSGIDELKVEFTLSPNPAKDILNISTDEQSISCSVFNLNGQLLLQQTLNNSQVLSVATLNNGMYLLQVQSGSRKTIQKFIINK